MSWGKIPKKNSPKPFLGEMLGEMRFPQKKKPLTSGGWNLVCGDWWFIPVF